MLMENKIDTFLWASCILLFLIMVCSFIQRVLLPLMEAKYSRISKT
uniref:Uncharacterized protein n=1 Tax=Brassica campestris TaxID=3711 RepID=A0A3P6B145_BRACM|nr:unnamed protein product [Brassica rapa]